MPSTVRRRDRPHRAALLCRDCGSRRCACCRPHPREPASAPALSLAWASSHPRRCRPRSRSGRRAIVIGASGRRRRETRACRPTRQCRHRRAARSQSLAKQPRRLDGGILLLGEGDRATGLALTIQIVAKRSSAGQRAGGCLVATAIARLRAGVRTKAVVRSRGSARSDLGERDRPESGLLRRDWRRQTGSGQFRRDCGSR
jgi:hypothetical protein